MERGRHDVLSRASGHTSARKAGLVEKQPGVHAPQMFVNELLIIFIYMIWFIFLIKSSLKFYNVNMLVVIKFDILCYILT